MSPETTEIGKVTSFVKPLGSRGYGTLDFTLQTLEPNCMSGVSLTELRKITTVLSQFLGDADPQTSCLAWESLRYLRTLEWGPDFLALFQGRPLYLGVVSQGLGVIVSGPVTWAPWLWMLVCGRKKDRVCGSQGGGQEEGTAADYID